MDEGAETLAGGGIPDASAVVLGVRLHQSVCELENGNCQTYINPSVEQLATNVPSRQKSMPLTGSLCAGKLRMSLPARTSHKKTASS